LNTDNDSEAIRLRAHHICCIPFWDTVFPERGEEFLRVEENIKEMIRSGSDAPVTVVEGVDNLCRECPLCSDDRCQSPRGNEDEVRKWDALLLREMELPFDTCLTAGEWRVLIAQKVPYQLCRRCQWQTECQAAQISR